MAVARWAWPQRLATLSSTGRVGTADEQRRGCFPRVRFTGVAQRLRCSTTYPAQHRHGVAVVGFAQACTTRLCAAPRGQRRSSSSSASAPRASAARQAASAAAAVLPVESAPICAASSAAASLAPQKALMRVSSTQDMINYSYVAFMRPGDIICHLYGHFTAIFLSPGTRLAC